MTEVVEGFEEDFENFKVLAAKRLRLFSDVCGDDLIHIYNQDRELKALFIDDRFFANLDYVDAVDPKPSDTE